jgi:hypothetical protein
VAGDEGRGECDHDNVSHQFGDMVNCFFVRIGGRDGFVHRHGTSNTNLDSRISVHNGIETIGENEMNLDTAVYFLLFVLLPAVIAFDATISWFDVASDKREPFTKYLLKTMWVETKKKISYLSKRWLIVVLIMMTGPDYYYQSLGLHREQFIPMLLAIYLLVELITMYWEAFGYEIFGAKETTNDG